MKCSKAIEILDLVAHDTMPPDITDFNHALDLAISCLQFRLNMMHNWVSSFYPSLKGEDREEPLAHDR